MNLVRYMACVRQLQSQGFLYLALMIPLLPKVLVSATTIPTSLAGCQDKCGSIAIPYPFGTSHGCYRNDGFRITCENTDYAPKALLEGAESSLEVININITTGELRVYKSIVYRCYDGSDHVYANDSMESSNLTGVPFLFSNTRNKFTAIGCYTLAYIGAQTDQQNATTAGVIPGVTVPGLGLPPVVHSSKKPLEYFTGCLSFCSSLNSTTGDNDSSCDGLGCCLASIPARLNYYEVQWGYNSNLKWEINPCIYAVLVEEDWFKFQAQDFLYGSNFIDSNPKGVPVVLDWAIRDNGACLQNGTERNPKPACISKHSSCQNTSNGDGYLCKCSDGYEGNPYIASGCIDINECEFPAVYSCKGICKNNDGSYDCPCKRGQKGDGKAGNCTEIIPYPAKVAIGSILGIAIFLGLCFLLAVHQQHKRHSKEKEEYQRYYQMMDSHLRVFNKKQIEIATDNFNEMCVLGTGGQGKVYKGLLENNQVVAIKRAKEVEETGREEFVNEILLLSQINHKNIVRLLGCCLEVKIPMLVYEFVPNGTLFELLHEKRNRISLGIRLQIASESAEALDYLHSCISRSILHGDVKSANILLDNDCCAKVSDFGASNLVPIDDTEVVKVVQGTRGYLDPEYVATAVLTKKSDVYSFGVVLLELITRKLAIFRDGNYERKHLASYFVSNARKNQLHELLDKDIVTTDEKVIEVLQEVSDLAVWCLSVRGEDRPTMSQVKEKLQNLVKLYNSVLGPKAAKEEKQSLLSAPTSYFTSDSSAFRSTSGSSVLEIEPRVPR